MNTRKILGWLCFFYSGLILFLQLFIIIMLIKLEIHDVPWTFHLGSIGMGVWFAAIGFQLVRAKPETNIKIKLIVYTVFLFPLMVLRGVEKIGELRLKTDYFPLIGVVLILFSVASLCVPYLFGNRFLKRAEKKKSRLDATPPQILQLIGMLWSLAPAAAGFYLYLLGSSKEMTYFLVGATYLALAAWWVWWRRRYSGTANPA